MTVNKVICTFLFFFSYSFLEPRSNTQENGPRLGCTTMFLTRTGFIYTQLLPNT
jgi:hypothetical protein